MNEPLALKVKRKRNDSVPSRRPVGRPNTPPPKLVSFSKFEPVKNIINQVIDQKCLKTEESDVRDNCKETDVRDNCKDLIIMNKKEDKKLTSISVNEQLRKLQKMHRKRKVNNLSNDNEKIDDIGEGSLLISSSLNVQTIFSMEILKETSSDLIVNDLNNIPLHSLRQARLELQTKAPVKVRLAVWKALRERKG